jgi:hypothetical protein
VVGGGGGGAVEYQANPGLLLRADLGGAFQLTPIGFSPLIAVGAGYLGAQLNDPNNKQLAFRARLGGGVEWTPPTTSSGGPILGLVLSYAGGEGSVVYSFIQSNDLEVFGGVHAGAKAFLVAFAGTLEAFPLAAFNAGVGGGANWKLGDSGAFYLSGHSDFVTQLVPALVGNVQLGDLHRF